MYPNFTELNADLIHCRLCPRLVAWREQMAEEKRRAYLDHEYWGKPVPGFGDPEAKVMVVGLAPGAHGSNRTGRMFTGDASGDFLYPALHRAGFANQPHAINMQDGLQLKHLFITAVCRCVPPGNKPTSQEIHTCLPWLNHEVELLPNLHGFVALGKIAYEGILLFFKQQALPTPGIKFSHNAFWQAEDRSPWILCSYHPSRQNTQTGRLTEKMFDEIWHRVNQLLS